MTQYRKKPVVIEAFQLQDPSQQGDAADKLHAWADANGFVDWTGEDDGIYIPTLEGLMHVSPGDWIIKGVAGEFYPCKPDIFAASYDRADTAPAIYGAMLEAAAHQVRYQCVVCNGTGQADPTSECEYCGRPIGAILSLRPQVPA